MTYDDWKTTEPDPYPDWPRCEWCDAPLTQRSGVYSCEECDPPEEDEQ